MSIDVAIEAPMLGYSFFAGANLRQIKFRIEWLSAMVSLSDHEWRFRKERSYKGKECAWEEYKQAIQNFVELERRYVDRLGYRITWRMPPAVEEFLALIRNLAALNAASPEEVCTDEWQENWYTAWLWRPSSADTAYISKPEDLRFRTVIDHCRWLIAIDPGKTGK